MLGQLANGGMYGQPIYRTTDTRRRNTLYTVTGAPVRIGRDGRASVSQRTVSTRPQKVTTPRRTAVVSRGGFGGRASGFGFGG